MPHWRCNLEPWLNILNMGSKWAIIPGDGNIQASFLTSQDMSRFVARLMNLKKWDKISAIRANTLSFNQLVDAAEKARGKLLHSPICQLILIASRFQVQSRSRQSGEAQIWQDILFP
jgi:hypothetical protein